MKKILTGVSLCLLAPFALAESSVTLYGQLDTGVTVQKLKGSSATVSLTNGNWYSTLWGIKGQEDLGNGNSVFFDLEQGFDLDNGTSSESGSAFGRQSYLGVSGDWGQVAFGRIGALGSDNGTYTIMGGSAYTTSFTSIGSVYSATMHTPYKAAIRRPRARFPLPFRKNDTVIGIIGNTQGVNKAAKPDKKAIKKMVTKPRCSSFLGA